MNGSGQSDRSIVPKKAANKRGAAVALAESLEERGLSEGNPPGQTNRRAQDRERLQQVQGRIRQAAKKDKQMVFTNLWHYVYDEGQLREAYYGFKRDSAPGGNTRWRWKRTSRICSSGYAEAATEPERRDGTTCPNLMGGSDPSAYRRWKRRSYSGRALRCSTRSTRNVSWASAMGFRPGRSQHDALDALYVGITQRKVLGLLDADISGFFDAMDHEWLIRFIEHQIQDKGVVRHIKKWLKAGILEEGKYRRSEQGSPQGGASRHCSAMSTFTTCWTCG